MIFGIDELRFGYPNERPLQRAPGLAKPDQDLITTDSSMEKQS